MKYDSGLLSQYEILVEKELHVKSLISTVEEIRAKDDMQKLEECLAKIVSIIGQYDIPADVMAKVLEIRYGQKETATKKPARRKKESAALYRHPVTGETISVVNGRSRKLAAWKKELSQANTGEWLVPEA